MSKRTRGTTRRRGNRAPAPRAAPTRATRAAVRPPSQLEAAAEIADDVVDDRLATAAEELERTARSVPGRSRTKPGSLLAARAANEYVYVIQDVRRIVVVAAGLFAVMLVLWLLIVVARVITF